MTYIDQSLEETVVSLNLRIVLIKMDCLLYIYIYSSIIVCIHIICKEGQMSNTWGVAQ